jgi:phage portal protein BeeE
VGVFATIRSSLRAVFAPGAAKPGSGAWMPIVREPYTGAWQNNDELRLETALANPVVFRCVSLIASDIGKLPLRLVAQDVNGIWNETESPAFSPVLATPNRYQTPAQFFETWMFSKLLWGNTYVLKDRDLRGVVTTLYVLDPCRVRVLVAPDGAVYYELQTNDLAGIPAGTGPLVVPAK